MTSSSPPLETPHVSDADLALAPDEHWPTYAEDEIEGVISTLRSGKVNQMTGDRVFAFQRAYDDFLGTGRSIALANGSLALELALRAFGVGPGDEVVVTPRTFVASAFCVMLVGATPVFAEVDPDSGNVTPETIAAVLTSRTKVIIPVHLAGWPCDMVGIMALAQEHGLLVIEDCAQAHGAEIDGRPIGAFGDAAAFSFCQDKILTTGGEGGLVTFRDTDAHDWAWSYKDHGKNPQTYFAPAAKPGFRWVHDSFGTNWRMMEMSAVIGLAQLAKLPEWRCKRAERAAIWADALRDVDGLRVPDLPAGVTNANYKFYAYVNRGPQRNEKLRDQILAGATARGIRAFSGSCSEVYLEAAFTKLRAERLPVARSLGESSLMFEVHPTLDLDRVRARAAAVAQIAREVLA